MTSTMFSHNPVTGQEVAIGDGPHSGWMTITPAKAREILDERNVNNRKISDRVAARYARDMRSGQWLTNGDAIRFAVDGTLLDGQHRLRAISLSGVTIRALVVWNLPREAQATMDDGRKRTMANVLELNGTANNHGKTIASILRRACSWDAGHKDGAARDGSSKLDMTAYFDAHPRVLLAAQVADSIRNAQGIRCAASTLGFAYYLFDRVSPDDAVTFFESLKTGAGLPVGSPVLLLRNKLSVSGSTRLSTESAETLAWFIKAWNAWRTGKTVRILRQKADESFPEPR